MSHAHDWSRWIHGRRTSLWFRHCLGCAASETAHDRPEDALAVRGMPDAYQDSETYSEAEFEVRGKLERFNPETLVDFRSKASRSHE